MSDAKILIVEDNAEVAETIRDIVSNVGFTADIATTADQVLTRLAEGSYALISLDLYLGNSDGIQILRLLAAESCDVPIVLTTGASDDLIQTGVRLGRALGLHMLQPLPKPTDPRRICDVLNSLKQPLMEGIAHHLHAELERAIANDEFIIHYQPQVCPATWESGEYKVEGAEALVRWQHPQRGLLMPQAFIPYAEKTALIKPMTRCIINQVMRQMAAWQDNGYDFPVSINLTPTLLTDIALPDELSALAEKYGINPANIVLEITETAALERTAQVMDILTRFILKGFTLSLDDFGAGYASLSSLAHMPFSEIKIDRSFVTDMTEFRKSETITRAIIALGRELGLTVCAEGVERIEIAERLIDMGCDLVQGYLFGRPVTASAFTALLNSTQQDIPTLIADAVRRQSDCEERAVQ